MSKSIEATIECPFYLEEGNNFIKCEGMLDKTTTTHTFNNNSDKRNFETTMCGVSGGRKCPHHRAVAILYDRGLR